MKINFFPLLLAEKLKNVEFLLNIWRTRRIRNIRLRQRLKGKPNRTEKMGRGRGWQKYTVKKNKARKQNKITKQQR